MKNKTKKIDFRIRPINDSDRGWIRKFIAQKWGSEKIVSLGKIYFPHKLPGLVAIKDKKYLGLITYYYKKNYFEIVTLNSLIEKKGIGSALVEKIKKVAKRFNCKIIQVTTTNDNVGALCLWQQKGFIIKAIRLNAINLTYRKLKPEIPKIGCYQIPIRDEILLKFRIK